MGRTCDTHRVNAQELGPCGEESMPSRHYLDVQGETFFSGARGVCKRTLIGKADSAGTFYLRHFTIEPSGYTPRHSHPWEHEIYVISGSGYAVAGGERSEIGEGMALFIPPEVEHQINASGEGLVFLCIIPAVEEG
jgi:quercetin dioxygenase-like cupin family protein